MIVALCFLLLGFIVFSTRDDDFLPPGFPGESHHRYAQAYSYAPWLEFSKGRPEIQIEM
jgi:hypothetical protein